MRIFDDVKVMLLDGSFHFSFDIEPDNWEKSIVKFFGNVRSFYGNPELSIIGFIIKKQQFLNSFSSYSCPMVSVLK